MTGGLASRISLLVLVLCSCSLAWATVEAVIGPVPIAQNTNLAIALPDTANSEILISRDQYVISYNKNRRAPNWVAWHLEASQIGTSGRSNAFQEDSELATYLAQNDSGFQAVKATDYTKSCFDRGHQIPSGDRTDTVADNTATFVMSNMIPQTPYLNRVIWEHLEQYTRDLVQQQGKTVYVIDGPIYDLDYGSIGPNRDIPVPSKDFKIIMVLDAGQTLADVNSNTQVIAVIMPNNLESGQAPVAFETNCGGSSEEMVRPQTTDDWEQYQTTLTDIEARSGLNFHLQEPQAQVGKYPLDARRVLH